MQKFHRPSNERTHTLYLHFSPRYNTLLKPRSSHPRRAPNRGKNNAIVCARAHQGGKELRIASTAPSPSPSPRARKVSQFIPNANAWVYWQARYENAYACDANDQSIYFFATHENTHTHALACAIVTALRSAHNHVCVWNGRWARLGPSRNCFWGGPNKCAHNQFRSDRSIQTMCVSVSECVCLYDSRPGGFKCVPQFTIHYHYWQPHRH